MAQAKGISAHASDAPAPVTSWATPAGSSACCSTCWTTPSSSRRRAAGSASGSSARAATRCCEVHDSGVGIAPGAVPHVFERFFRGDPARSCRVEGAGPRPEPGEVDCRPARRDGRGGQPARRWDDHGGADAGAGAAGLTLINPCFMFRSAPSASNGRQMTTTSSKGERAMKKMLQAAVVAAAVLAVPAMSLAAQTKPDRRQRPRPRRRRPTPRPHPLGQGRGEVDGRDQPGGDGEGQGRELRAGPLDQEGRRPGGWLDRHRDVQDRGHASTSRPT